MKNKVSGKRFHKAWGVLHVLHERAPSRSPCMDVMRLLLGRSISHGNPGCCSSHKGCDVPTDQGSETSFINEAGFVGIGFYKGSSKYISPQASTEDRTKTGRIN